MQIRKPNFPGLLQVFRKPKVKRRLPIKPSLRKNVKLKKSLPKSWPKLNNKKLLMQRELRLRKPKLRLKLLRKPRQPQKHALPPRRVLNH